MLAPLFKLATDFNYFKHFVQCKRNPHDVFFKWKANALKIYVPVSFPSLSSQTTLFAKDLRFPAKNILEESRFNYLRFAFYS